MRSRKFVSAAAALLFPGAAAAAAAAVPPSHSRTVQLSGTQMLALAERLLAAGNRAEASRIYELLARDPHSDIRNEARFRQAKLLESDGRETEAAVLLRRILDERPDAAPVRLELAQLLGRMGDTDAALRELRAAQASGLPPAVARIVDRYSQALRASRPLGGSLEIALAPDSNINHATRSDSLGTIFGDFDIDKESKAKSGTGLSLRGQAFRRYTLGESGHSLLVRLSGFADLYTKARFNDVAVDLAAGPELRLGRTQLNLEVGATQRWFGQKPFTRSERLGATWTRPLGKRAQLRLTGAAALVDNRFNDLQDGKTFSGRLDLERAFSGTTGARLELSLNRESLRDPGYSTLGWRSGLLGWHDVGRMTFTAEAEIGKLRADERLQLFPDKRRDRYSRLSLGATFRQLEFHGFAPIARFTVERNKSSIEFYDWRGTRTELGVARAF